MSAPNNRRQSQRVRASRNYVESPVESPIAPKSASKNRKTSNKDDLPATVKTPKSSRKSTRKASEESPEFSPKKLRRDRTPSLKAIECVVLTDSSAESSKNSRRSVRQKKTTQLFKTNTPLKVGKENKGDLISDDDGDLSTEPIAKSSTLFDEDKDVGGSELYMLKTPKKKDSMVQLAQRTPKTPRHNDPNKQTPKTPKNKRISQLVNTPTSRPSASKCTKTPRHVREEMKKELVKTAYGDSDEDEDFSADESDYEDDESPSSDESSIEDQDTETPPKKTPRGLKTPSVISHTPSQSTRRSARNRAANDYVLQPDEYFSTATAKTKTSNHTLDKLKNPRLPQDQLNKMLTNMKISKEHEQKIRELNEDHEKNFNRWLELLLEGYTVLLHGFGSKRNLLINFHKEMLAKQHVIVINGFFPSLTIKAILDAICVDLLELTGVPGNSNEAIDLIKREMKAIPALRIFLIVHNLDGVMLRNGKAQSVMSQLASIGNIHMIASIDHINTPLLWNSTKISNYNFAWFDCTSFLPYTEETSYTSSLFVKNSGALELASMKSVFQSLTTNARGIFTLLLKFQLKNNGTPNYQGMAFKDLYSNCREAFLVSSDVALRAQLTEFFDHKLAKSKRSIDGLELITIPLKNFLLEQFLNEQ